jgi:hypothetical protein
MIEQKVPRYLAMVKEGLREIYETGKAVLPLFVVMGKGMRALSHEAKAFYNTARGIRAAMEGTIKWSDFATMNFYELAAALDRIEKKRALVLLEQEAMSLTGRLEGLEKQAGHVRSAFKEGLIGPEARDTRLIEIQKALEGIRIRMKEVNAEYKRLQDIGKSQALVEGMEDVLDAMDEIGNWKPMPPPKEKIIKAIIPSAGEVSRVYMDQFAQVERASMVMYMELKEGWDGFMAHVTGQGLPLSIMFTEESERARQALEDFYHVGGEAAQRILDQFDDTTDEMRNLADDTAQSVGSSFTSIFGDTIRGELREFSDYFARFVQDLADTWFRSLIARIISKEGLGFLAGLLPGGGGSSGEARGHAGGVVGASFGVKKPVDPSVFIGAPRLHKGLMADEYPAILQRGETVTPKGKSAKPVQVIVNNNMPVEPQTRMEETADATRVLVTIGDMVHKRIDNSIMNQGSTAKALSNAFGLTRRGRNI